MQGKGHLRGRNQLQMKFHTQNNLSNKLCGPTARSQIEWLTQATRAN